MKRTHSKLAAFLAALLIFGITPANALPETQVKAIKKAMTDVPALELAPKAASIVQKASANDKEEVAVAVTRIVLSRKPNLAATVVEAIAEVAPQTSAAIAAVAAELCPAQAEQIARIAASYAPEQAAQIASGVAKAAPKSAANIARRVVGVVPELSDKVTEAVIAAVPSSKAEIESDATLIFVSSLAKNTRSSASQPVRKNFRSKPNNNLTGGTTTVTSTKVETRSPALEAAIKEVSSSAKTAGLSDADQAALVTSFVNFASATQNPTIDKAGLDTLVANGLAATKSILTTTGPLTLQQKTEGITATLAVFQSVAADKGTTQAEKQQISQFVQNSTTAAATDPLGKAKATVLVEEIKQLVVEVQKISVIARTTDDPNAIKAQLDTSAKQIGETAKKYAQP